MDNETYPCYVNIREGAKELVELPTEKDGTMLLSTLVSQFPDAVGLRFKSESGTWRGVRLTEENLLDAPVDGWGNTEYHVVMPKRAGKRKVIDHADESPLDKMSKITETEILSDLVVMSLSYSATNADVREHFESYGQLESCDIKYDNQGRSRGFGFIRFKTVEAVRAALDANHVIQGREVDLCFPQTNDDDIQSKLFIGRLPKGLKEEEFREYFEKFGEIKEAYLPTPFRGFGFVSFKKKSSARIVLECKHCLKGQYLNVSFPSKSRKDTRNDMKNENTGYAWNPGYGNQSFGNQGFGFLGYRDMQRRMQGLRGMQGMYPRVNSLLGVQDIPQSGNGFQGPTNYRW